MNVEHPYSRLERLVRKLRGPDGCPWDREQNHRSLRSYVIEEAYEVVDAIDAMTVAGDQENGNGNKLREELGDLLLQVVLHAELASEAGRFTLADVFEGLSEKIIRRHPHVFNGAAAATREEVLAHWERVKHEERQEKEVSEEGRTVPGISSLGAPIAGGTPALLRAFKIQQRAARAGFDFSSARQATAKVWEEAREVREAQKQGSPQQLEAEVGDLFFALVNVARWLGVQPEMALNNASRRFEKRFQGLEESVRTTGEQVEQLSMEALDEHWEMAKKHQKRTEGQD
ncbi:MAG: nucleoside triphosphate pyrophosphohydrolase [Thermaerobacterales bacterium]